MKQIASKMLAIMDDVRYIQKDAVNQHQKYNYASEKAIKQAVQDALIKHHVHFQLSVKNPSVVSEKVVAVECDYTFTDADSGEQIHGSFVGSGQTRDEKGVYAAITGAIKYCLTSNFLIATGDDAEADDDARPVVRQEAATKKKPTRKQLTDRIAQLEEEAEMSGMLTIVGIEQKRRSVMTTADLDKAAEAALLDYGKILATELEQYRKDNK